jgi:glutamate-ammonia-ligase adenylyltransferase
LSRACLIPLNKTNFSNLTLKDFYFRTSIQLKANIIKPGAFAEMYTEFLNQKINSLINGFIQDIKWSTNFFIAAMGSFGSMELSFASDVDLVFVVRDIFKYPNIQRDFQKLLQNLKDNLPGLEIDCRLRPEGKSSQLVWDIEDYKKYFTNRVRIWELQAFSKCRFVYGAGDLFEDFMNYYINTIKKVDPALVKKEMIDMRKKLYPINETQFNLKKSSGGLVDIDFIVSFLLLTNPELLVEGINGKQNNFLRLIGKVSNKEINFDQLKANYNSLKIIELTNQLVFNSRLSKLPTEALKLTKLAKVCGFSDSKTFLNKLNEIIEQTKKQYQNIFN